MHTAVHAADIPATYCFIFSFLILVPIGDVCRSDTGAFHFQYHTQWQKTTLSYPLLSNFGVLFGIAGSSSELRFHPCRVRSNSFVQRFGGMARTCTQSRPVADRPISPNSPPAVPTIARS